MSRYCHSNAFSSNCALVGQVFGDGIQPCRVQHGEGFLPHFCEREVASNTFIREQFENLASLGHVGIGGHPEVVNQFLGGIPGIVAMLPDVMKQALDQIVMQFLVAVLNETEQICIDCGFA